MHPSIRILTLLMFALAVYAMPDPLLDAVLLLMLAAMLVGGSAGEKGQGALRFPALEEFLKLIRRVRFILLFLLIVYACNTPGEYVDGWNFPIVPTYEGLDAGVRQMLRLAVVLAGLALLLATTGRDQLIAGLYWPARPLRYVGVDAERFAVRLWLTLYYVEHGMKDRQRNFLQQLMALSVLPDDGHKAPERIAIMKPVMRPLDVWVLFGLLFLAGILLCV